MPVKDEWIVGKALFSIPLLGYLPLNIVPVAIVLIALMLVWEYVAGKKDKGIEKREKEKKRVKGKK